ncbi:MAG: pyrimidine dimer DNA glycosylase/endonuclease V [Exilispira sp.]|jgi:hypothetical protein|nr:pyrimidine dimer DNA glycosylase/endonuclease V [Exilispira sp.]
MRLWSISPKYLDTKGLLALWREALLAKKVLEGKTKGYKKHPQLIRFKKTSDPTLYINLYLIQVYYEAKARRYQFDFNKIDNEKIMGLNFLNLEKIKVTKGQIKYEFEFLKKKLKKRDLQKYLKLENIENDMDIEINPIFEIIEGEIEEWEKVKII